MFYIATRDGKVLIAVKRGLSRTRVPIKAIAVWDTVGKAFQLRVKVA